MRSSGSAIAPTGRSALRLLTLATLAGLAGCGPTLAGSLSAPAPAEECRVAPEAGDGEHGEGAPGSRGDAVEVGLTHPVDPLAAPIPANPDEAFLFRLLYEPLLRLDCTGRRYPALASAWRSADEGRRWTFVLREDARFWNGDPVTASDVASSWKVAERSDRRPWRGRRPVRVLVEDERRLTVVFRERHSAVPGVLAGPALAVVREDGSDGWPVMGTGAYRVVEGSVTTSAIGLARASGDDGTVAFLGLEEARESTGLPERLHVRVRPTEDSRELLDAGVDLILTGNRNALAYARLRPELSVHSLPWSRTYVLALPGSAESGAGDVLPPDFLDTLAREAVGAEARPALEAVAPTTGGDLCPAPDPFRARARARDRSTSVEPSSPTPVRRIVYPRGDPTARELSERIVALSGPQPVDVGVPAASALSALGLGGRSSDVVASALDPEGIPPPLRADSGEGLPGDFRPSGALAYVVGMPRRLRALCPPPHTLRRPGVGPAGAGGFPYVLRPLVDTRRQVVVRSPGVALAVDADGTPFLVPAEGR